VAAKQTPAMRKRGALNDSILYALAARESVFYSQEHPVVFSVGQSSPQAVPVPTSDSESASENPGIFQNQFF
jgi:hypothetical protein